MGLFDVHAHLTHPRLAPDAEGVLASARAAGVTTIVSNGLNPEDNEAVAALAARSELVRPAFGLYPVDAVLDRMQADGVDYPRAAGPWTGEEAVRWVRDHLDDCVAVGEIGLDGYWVPEAYWARQEELFRALVRLAVEADKPVIIHSRKRERRCLEILEEEGAARVDWHCFGGRVKLAAQCAARGHKLSIPANARRNQAFSGMIRKLPRESLLLETDCPYLGPVPGERNDPSTVAGTAAYMAELWDEPLDAVHARLAENFEALFGFSP